VFLALKCELQAVRTLTLTAFHGVLSQLSYVGICYTQGNADDLVNEIILKCTALTILDLEGNFDLSFRALKNISSCKILKYLDVANCRELGKKAMRYVTEGCPGLEFLDVSGIHISERMFQQILRCSNLKCLLIKDCDLSEINLNLIPVNISGLSHLCIGPHLQIRDDVISDMKNKMPHLSIVETSTESGIIKYKVIKKMYIKKYI
jgi:hypothetical protein